MPNNLLKPAVFFTGLLALGWIAAGYIGASLLALSVVLLIGACYVAGGLELHRYRQATASLAQAVADLSEPVARLDDWLAPLPASLRYVVRQRIEGERVPLPAPALTPYLVGLLVLLGMLGTLLGMMTTLRGTGLALESATDLEAIRTSLAAPVKGLAFAFGTSIAGVAASAMLGLLSALCRRERAAAAQALDAAIATTLRHHSRTHQREEAFRLLQRQVDTMPALVDQLQATMAAIEQQSLAANERQVASQAAFHDRTEAAYARLGTSIQQSVKDSIQQSLGAHEHQLAQQTAFHERTEAAHARLAASVEQSVKDSAQQSLATHERQLAQQTAFHERTEAVHARWAASVEQSVKDSAQQSLAAHERQMAQQTAFHDRAEAVHARLAASVEQSLKDSVADSARAASAALQPVVETTMAALAQHAASLHDRVAEAMQRQLEALSGGLHDSTATVADLWTDALAQQRQSSDALLHELRGSLEQFAATFEQRSTDVVDRISTRFETASDHATAAWNQALTQQTEQGEALADTNRQALTAAAAAFESHAAALVDAVQQSHADLQAALDARAEASSGLVDTIAARFEAASDSATAAWTEALSRQSAVGETLARSNEQALTTAVATFESHAASLLGAVQQSHAQLQATLGAQTQAHARETIAEISRLVHDAAEAPKAAAAVIAELRQNLSESMVRDTAMLEERGRLLATVETLLSAVNHASAEQRAAVDALISTSADALERVATRFTGHVETETARLDAAADRITAGAIEVASLGDVLGAAVQGFGEANEQLVARLHAVEDALGQSLARSDEQLAYYVAQAREVVDLSVLAQKQIIGELQQLARPRASAGADAA
ncbi:DUF802 domain-containing protein [Lysobacter korlensis]|uniref:DUF802 domain-containing protein n=1 Tax=Lysobacter korlensis TaxID=553636 RepID=A0ABV6RLF9_9GAMM